jgi:uncharacterized Zn finger protein
MCKHVAAVLYGVGARLDQAPEMLFALRGVDPTEMVEAAVEQPAKAGKPRKGRTLASEDLSSVFGIDIDMDGVSEGGAAPPARRKRTAARTPKTAKKPQKRAAAVRKAKSRVKAGKQTAAK